MNLFICHYTDVNPKRNTELEMCLRKNIACRSIKKIYAICQSEPSSNILNNEKVQVVMIKSRPTYNVFFEVIKKVGAVKDWNIVANSDIYFDETLKLIPVRYSNQRVLIALTRWEVNANGSVTFLNRNDSQDTWIFNGCADVDGDFYMGQPGCDNVIAERFHKSGYKVVNPSRTIKTYHVHLSNVRNYNSSNRLKPPYRLIQPTA